MRVGNQTHLSHRCNRSSDCLGWRLRGVAYPVLKAGKTCPRCVAESNTCSNAMTIVNGHGRGQRSRGFGSTEERIQTDFFG